MAKKLPLNFLSDQDNSHKLRHILAYSTPLKISKELSEVNFRKSFHAVLSLNSPAAIFSIISWTVLKTKKLLIHVLRLTQVCLKCQIASQTKKKLWPIFFIYSEISDFVIEIKKSSISSWTSTCVFFIRKIFDLSENWDLLNREFIFSNAREVWKSNSLNIFISEAWGYYVTSQSFRLTRSNFKIFTMECNVAQDHFFYFKTWNSSY